MRISPWIATALLALVACRSRETPAAKVIASREDAGAPRDAPVAVLPDAGRAAPSDELTALRRDGEALLARWLDAQNRGDVAAYDALYEPAHFRGIKRTSGGKVRTYDGAGWARDRKRMLEIGVQVAAEQLAVETWLDPASTLKAGVISLRFLQRWRGGAYADHGIKVLQAWRSPRGEWRIVYEDLLNAEPGWDRAVDAAAPLALRPPATDAEALALWTQVAPSGADYEDRLAAIPDEPAIRRPMARALLAEGNLACAQIVDAGACGEVILEWAPLSPKADLGDPCLRRRLALWSVEQLTPPDLAGLQPALIAMVGLPPPEAELPAAAFGLLPAGADDLRLALLGAAVRAKRGELAEAEVAGLTSDPAILEAATALSLDAAIARLDRAKHRVQLLTALADDELEVDTRIQILTDYAADRGVDVTRALTAMTRHSDCRLAMAAVAILADRGTPSYLPRRPPATGTDADLRRALCLVAHDPDAARRDVRWRELLAPQVVVRSIVQRDFDDTEADAASQSDEDAPSGTIVTRGDGPGTETSSWETVDRDTVELGGGLAEWAGCPGGACDAGPFELVIARDASGRRWITEIIERRWEGCPC